MGQIKNIKLHIVTDIKNKTTVTTSTTTTSTKRINMSTRLSNPSGHKGDNFKRYCMKEYLQSQACMWERNHNNNDDNSNSTYCQEQFKQYNKCKKECSKIYWKRWRAAIFNRDINVVNVPPKGIDPMMEDYDEPTPIPNSNNNDDNNNNNKEKDPAVEREEMLEQVRRSRRIVEEINKRM